MATQFFRKRNPETNIDDLFEVGTNRHIGPTEFGRGQGFVEVADAGTPTDVQNGSVPEFNKGLQVFTSIMGHGPQSDTELATIDAFNQNQLQQNTTPLDAEVQRRKQTSENFSDPTAFLALLKTGLRLKLKPEEEEIGQSKLFKKAGLGGFPTLLQSLGARHDQIIRSGADLAALLDSAGARATSFADQARQNYEDILSEQTSIIERQQKLEDNFRNRVDADRLMRKEIELDKELFLFKEKNKIRASSGVSGITTGVEPIKFSRDEKNTLRAFNLQNVSQELQNIFMNAMNATERKEFQAALKREQDKGLQSIDPGLFLQEWLDRKLLEELNEGGQGGLGGLDFETL